MKQSHLEREIRELYDLLETIEASNKEIFELKEDDLVRELEKIKYKYFKKGYLACLMHDK
ncbi:hypothetical protein [Sebaldella sp. S0638]|uniref:hypothetical protein n=1 Tax=Sebaldella sp. S0638 TaxID=2957809 RepID=UPI0020A14D28|nr:hypothetical protein [Sebaldella sp. S0638]